MLNNWKEREDSAAVGVLAKEILPYWAEPAEESESRDSSSPSLGMRSVMTRWGLCLGSRASRGVQGLSASGEGCWVLDE